MKARIICAVALAAFTLVCTTATAGKPVKPPPIPVPEPVGYYAANGALVGPFYNGLTVMTVEGRSFLLGVDGTWVPGIRSGAKWTLRGELLFDTDGCVGTAYIESNWDTTGFKYLAKVLWDPQGYQLHVAEFDLVSSVRIESYLRNGICEDEGNDVIVYPVLVSYNLDAMFPLPLTIK